ncbi:MAG: hypothetical protein HZA51_14995 [Planctomycetes bacterium]|nr:hypothetical protein [Planctomycetota bacterium]
MIRHRFQSFAVVALAAICTTGVHADPQKDAQNKALSQRAATADAYRKLGEMILGFQLNSETYVKDFVAESDNIRTSFDGFVRGVRLGKPKWDSEMVASIEAEVTVAKVVEELKSIHQREYKGNTIKATDFDSITSYVKKDILKVVGMGAPRPDLPPGIPGGELAMPAGVTAPEPAVPAIWKQIPAQERLMAAKAAERDAQRKLVERIKGLRVTSETRVRDFVAESDRIDTEAAGMLTGAHQVGKPYYHDEELIVEVTYEVPVESVITTIKELHKRHYKGDKVSGMDVEHVTQEIKTQNFQATGMGVPRPSAIKAVAATMQMPDWVGQNVSAEGNGVPPKDAQSPAQARLMAARAAELDAKRRLGEQVMGFAIDSKTTVRDFVTQHDEINTQIMSYMTDARVVETKFDGEGTATVRVEIPAMKVWEIVHTSIKVSKF